MRRHPQFSSLRAAVRVFLLLPPLLIAFPITLIFWMLTLQRPRGRIVQILTVYIRRVIGLRVTEDGRVSKLRPLMIVSNHASYLDVFVIGSRLPVSFTPKVEVRRWPVIGFFCVLADCIFVERKPGQMEEARDEMALRIEEGRVLCLFPEGTTSDGKNVKPFKSGFLSLAEHHKLPIQPVSLAYTRIGNEPITDATRDMVAWIGEATFFSHFWHVLGLPSVSVTLLWHDTLSLNDFDDRKALTKAAEVIITAGVMAKLESTY